MSPTQQVQALISGDPKTVSQIYQTNLPKVVSFVLKNKGNREDAQDIFQMAILQIATRYKANPFEIHSSFEAYLFTVCKNLWRRSLNSSKNKVTNNEFLEPTDDNTQVALSALEQERWELYQNCFKELSENCQAVLKLFFNKVSYSQMVSQLGYNTETVARQRVFKCKKKLTELVVNHKAFNSLRSL